MLKKFGKTKFFKIVWFGLNLLLIIVALGSSLYALPEIVKAKPANQPKPVATAVPPTPAPPLKGTSLEAKFYSPILKREMPYRIYLPADYYTSDNRYPVLYMLHGMSGSYEEWIDYHLFDIADEMMDKGQIKPMIIVLPSGDREYWVDHANNGPQWGEYVVRDVINQIDTTYRTIPHTSDRAVGGHSMGGHGALQLAFNHPDVFGIAGAHSPTMRTRDTSPEFFGDQTFYAAHDPVSLAKTSSNLEHLKIWVDIGMHDSLWRPRAEELHQVLTGRGIPHQWHLDEGGHTAEYWTGHVPAYLQFYSSSFE
jgi:enterochelin esterase-like enzyme